MGATERIATGRHFNQALYIDIEMTCWSQTPPAGMRPEIIEIGVVLMDLGSLEICAEASHFVRPKRWEISDKCAKLTGITTTDIQSAKPFDVVIGEITESFQPKGKLCVTWGASDTSAIADACRQYGLVSPFRNHCDIDHLFKRNFLFRDSVSLREAVSFLGLTFDGFPHGALPDARNTAYVHAAIIRRLRNEVVPPSTPSKEEILPAPISDFGAKLSRSLESLSRNE